MKLFFKKEEEIDYLGNGKTEPVDKAQTDVQKVARIAGILLFIFPLFYLFLLFYIEISPFADPVEIYLRNISSVVALFVLGGFLDLYYKSYFDLNERVMRSFKAIVVCLAIAAIIKVLISIFYLIVCISNGNFVLWFYVGEIIIWTAVAIFAILYHKRLSV